MPPDLLCRLSGVCTQRTLAWVSTIFSILALVLTYGIARSLLDEPTALVALALTAVSPLQLAMGRRALTDETGCAAFLLVLLALIKWMDTRRWTWGVLLLVAGFWMVGVKEFYYWVWAGLGLMLILKDRKWLVGVAAVPIASYLFISWLTWDWTALPRLLPILHDLIKAPYHSAYQVGPPHRMVIDFMALSPAVTLLALVSPVKLWRQDRYVLLFVPILLIAGVFTILNVKNLRYLTGVDPLMRILAAGVMMESPLTPLMRWGIVSVIMAWEYTAFWAIFEVGGVYDPTSCALFWALRMVPTC